MKAFVVIVCFIFIVESSRLGAVIDLEFATELYVPIKQV